MQDKRRRTMDAELDIVPLEAASFETRPAQSRNDLEGKEWTANKDSRGTGSRSGESVFLESMSLCEAQTNKKKEKRGREGEEEGEEGKERGGGERDGGEDEEQRERISGKERPEKREGAAREGKGKEREGVARSLGQERAEMRGLGRHGCAR